MNSRSRSWILALLVIAIALVAITLRAVRHPDDSRSAHEDEPQSVLHDMSIVEEPAPQDVAETRPIEAIPTPPPAPIVVVPDVRVAAPSLDLHSAEATVETAASLLREGRDDDFIATFLPSVRARLTPRAIERCRARVVTSNTPLRPDWEVAEESTEDGHRVRRVSMYGHETTGFHDVDGHWLADRAWCVPTDVPDDAS